MKKNYIQILEDSIPKYKDIKDIKVIENNEPFVAIDKTLIPFGPSEIIVVRKSVYEMLILAQKKLQKINPEFSLFLTYGYRSLEKQTKRFIEEVSRITTFFENPEDLYEEIHRFVAVPTVAGHPTGGAIDIVIINRNTNKILDFGNKQYDYTTKDCYVFSKNIIQNSLKNRLLLRELLTKVGFAPFNGEWWHFSYGDRDWAYYYKKRHALYEQEEYNAIKNMYNI